ncbi:MAG: tRNA pseudouridine(38-40) synthase TruA [Erysipelotrichaceae bacterium]|nr:tRNA pseudouridine(38-40) synthase TruA [Erysipelotrichaceae bacterium]
MRYKVTVSYDGSAYYGWQKQPNVHSIQETIENVLETIHQYPVEITASGRTDAYVHALGQVFHFDSDKDISQERWKAAFNSQLPKQIRVQEVIEVHEDFHARFDALYKRYDYVVTNQVDNPFVENYMVKERKQLDIAYMQECANVFLGKHDFTSFTSNKIDPRKSREKTIIRLDIVKEEDCIRMIFVGDGFLRYMVRMIAQTLIEVGKHKLTKEDVQRMLEGKNKHLCRYKGAPQGLYLVYVLYDEEDLYILNEKERRDEK